jgi:hypothetical protein
VARTLLDPERIASGTLVVLGVLVFMGSFTFIKESLPGLHPFAWDRTFAAWDEAIHGVQPYRLLWPILGSPGPTMLLGGLYQLWFFVLFHLLFVAAFSKSRTELRLTFLNAFVLAWGIGGNLLAVAFASAGPVYFERLGLGRDFAPLMRGLNDLGHTGTVWAVHVQDALWTAYKGGGGQIAGISAMPSMHVGSSVLFCLFGIGFGRRIGWLMAAFALCILLASVHLGWHYAVDGYAAVVVALVSWWTARRLQRLGPNRPVPGRHPSSGHRT